MTEIGISRMKILIYAIFLLQEYILCAIFLSLQIYECSACYETHVFSLKSYKFICDGHMHWCLMQSCGEQLASSGIFSGNYMINILVDDNYLRWFDILSIVIYGRLVVNLYITCTWRPHIYNFSVPMVAGLIFPKSSSIIHHIFLLLVILDVVNNFIWLKEFDSS
jgi:hypothetical protein